MSRFLVRDSVKAIRFDGTDDYLTVPVNPSLTAFSILTWIKMPLAASSDRVIDWGASGPSGGMNLVLNVSNGRTAATYTMYNSTTTVAGHNMTIGHGRWTHVVMTYTLNSAKLYRNATLIGTDTSCEMTEATGQTLTIGRRSATSGNFYEGLMDEFILVNDRVVDTDEIEAHYYRGVAPTGATVHYVFNDSVVDISGNGNDATANGSPAYVTDRPFALRS